MRVAALRLSTAPGDAMSDDHHSPQDDAARSARDPASQAEVQTRPPEALRHWAQELGVTTDALQAAVQAVGPRVDRVKDFLTGAGAGGQSDG
jgi:hypothetical protein